MRQSVWQMRSCFNPRRPHGRRPAPHFLTANSEQFQSAPPSRAAAGSSRRSQPPRLVSIRAALTGGGQLRQQERRFCRRFNPRRPHGRRRAESGERLVEVMFQSAPPSRAAAAEWDAKQPEPWVSIRAALTGGGLTEYATGVRDREFQSAPPSRAAACRPWKMPPRRRFQSAPPSRAAAPTATPWGRDLVVSIRAALTGGGHPWRTRRAGIAGFNPRRPHGRRPSMDEAPE